MNEFYGYNALTKRLEGRVKEFEQMQVQYGCRDYPRAFMVLEPDGGQIENVCAYIELPKELLGCKIRYKRYQKDVKMESSETETMWDNDGPEIRHKVIHLGQIIEEIVYVLEGPLQGRAFECRYNTNEFGDFRGFLENSAD